MRRECFQHILSARYVYISHCSITIRKSRRKSQQGHFAHDQLRHRLGGTGEEINPSECNTQHRVTEAFPTGPPNVPLLGALSRLGDENARLPNVCRFLLVAIPLYSRCPFHPVWPVVTLDVLRAPLGIEAILNG